MGETFIVTCTLFLGDPTKVVYKDTLSCPTEIDEDIDRDLLRRDTRNWLARRVAEGVEGYSEEEARLLGRHLYETLFRGEIRNHFEQRIATVREQKDWRLRLQLIFHPEAGELARLPWEFLFPNTGGGKERFLAGEVEQFVLTRFVGDPSEAPGRAKEPDPVERPIKLLLAACTEEGFEAEEIKGLVILLDAAAKARADSGAPPDVEVRRLPSPTYGQLQDAVQGVVRKPDGTVDDSAEPWRPDVVHVIGHGEPGAIMLRRDPQAIADDLVVAEDAKARRVPVPPVAREKLVDADLLRGLFEPYQPKFVFLQTCYSDAIDSAALYTTAQRIVQAGVPAVVAMQYDIERGPADKFACRVYQRLLDGERIDAAVSEGRRHLREPEAGATSPYRAFGTPVIYLGHDGPLVKERPKARKELGKANPEPSQRDAEGRDCPRCGRANCRYNGCPKCGLWFKCTSCDRFLEDPMGVMCTFCRAKIEQLPYLPPKPSAGNGKQPVESTPGRARPVLSSPVSTTGQPPDQTPGALGGEVTQQ